MTLALLFGRLDEFFQPLDGNLQIFIIFLEDFDFLGGPGIGLQLERIHDEAAAAVHASVDGVAEALGEPFLGELAAEVRAVVE